GPRKGAGNPAARKAGTARTAAARVPRPPRPWPAVGRPRLPEALAPVLPAGLATGDAGADGAGCWAWVPAVPLLVGPVVAAPPELAGWLAPPPGCVGPAGEAGA